MNQPLLSVIMSVYHPLQKDLDKTIASVLEQSMPDFEFIIIQDDDLVETRMMLEKWQKQDARIKLIENKCNLGLITSLNKGLDASQTDLIARIDVGDWWTFDKLEKQKKLFDADEHLVLCGTQMNVVDEIEKSVAIFDVASTNESIHQLLRDAKNPFYHPSVMFRKTALRYNENALYCEDYELWCRYSRLGIMANINQPLCHYLMNSNSITQAKRAVMIRNTTRVYCAFMKALHVKDFSFIYQGLSVAKIPHKEGFFENSSNRWYAKATSFAWRAQHIRKTCCFVVALVLNPSLIFEKLKRLTCKHKYKKTYDENHPS